MHYSRFYLGISQPKEVLFRRKDLLKLQLLA